MPILNKEEIKSIFGAEFFLEELKEINLGEKQRNYLAFNKNVEEVVQTIIRYIQTEDWVAKKQARGVARPTTMNVILEKNTIEELFLASKNLKEYSILAPLEKNFANYGIQNQKILNKNLLNDINELAMVNASEWLY